MLIHEKLTGAPHALVQLGFPYLFPCVFLGAWLGFSSAVWSVPLIKFNISKLLQRKIPENSQFP